MRSDDRSVLCEFREFILIAGGLLERGWSIARASFDRSVV